MSLSHNPEATRRNAAPYLHGPEIDAVAAALRAGQYGHNTATERFENDLAAFLGVPDVVAVCSATAALHLGLILAGVGPGHEVIVPSQTFCATIQAILMVGASPHFIETSPDTLCIQSDDVLLALSPATRAVVPVLYGGRAVDLSDIHSVLAERGIAVIEDAAHAFGSHCGSKRVGNTGALTCFSFGPIKNLTCGEGGALIPRTSAEAERARTLRLLGVTQSQAERVQTTTYDVNGFGLRYHLSALHAAIGIVQLERFEKIEATRKLLWSAYADAVRDVDDVRLVDVDVAHSTPFNCVVRVPHRDAVFADLRARDIAVGVHYPPNHLQPAFAPWRRSLPMTEAVGQEILSLPFHPAMTDVDARHAVLVLQRALRTVTERRSPHRS